MFPTQFLIRDIVEAQNTMNALIDANNKLYDHLNVENQNIADTKLSNLKMNKEKIITYNQYLNKFILMPGTNMQYINAKTMYLFYRFIILLRMNKKQKSYDNDPLISTTGEVSDSVADALNSAADHWDPLQWLTFGIASGVIPNDGTVPYYKEIENFISGAQKGGAQQNGGVTKLRRRVNKDSSDIATDETGRFAKLLKWLEKLKPTITLSMFKIKLPKLKRLQKLISRENINKLVAKLTPDFGKWVNTLVSVGKTIATPITAVVAGSVGLLLKGSEKLIKFVNIDIFAEAIKTVLDEQGYKASPDELRQTILSPSALLEMIKASIQIMGYKALETFNNLLSKAWGAAEYIESGLKTAYDSLKTGVSSAYASAKDKASSAYASVKDKASRYWYGKGGGNYREILVGIVPGLILAIIARFRVLWNIKNDLESQDASVRSKAEETKNGMYKCIAEKMAKRDAEQYDELDTNLHTEMDTLNTQKSDAEDKVNCYIAKSSKSSQVEGKNSSKSKSKLAAARSELASINSKIATTNYEMKKNALRETYRKNSDYDLEKIENNAARIKPISEPLIPYDSSSSLFPSGQAVSAQANPFTFPLGQDVSSVQAASSVQPASSGFGNGGLAVSLPSATASFSAIPRPIRRASTTDDISDKGPRINSQDSGYPWKPLVVPVSAQPSSGASQLGNSEQPTAAVPATAVPATVVEEL